MSQSTPAEALLETRYVLDFRPHPENLNLAPFLRKGSPVTKAEPSFEPCLIHKLHDDVLHEIFIATAGDKQAVKAFAAHEAEIITQVCRRWRTIAEGSPQLWNLVHIDMRHTPTRTGRWLSLSGRMELAIRWGPFLMLCSEDLQSCVEMLKPHASRIGSFVFTSQPRIESQEILPNLIPLLSTSTILHTLHLQPITEATTWWPVAKITLPDHTFPALCDLKLVQIDILWIGRNKVWGALSLRIWNQTISFGITFATYSSYRQISITWQSADGPPSTLHLSKIPPNEASQILELIHAPVLVDLLVTTGFDLPNLVPTITNASSTIRSLCISFSPHAENAIMATLNSTPPQLDCLHLLSHTAAGVLRINETLLEGLNACGSVTILRLECISFIDEELIGVISRRRDLKGCSRIKKIIFDKSPVSSGLRACLRELEVHVIDRTGGEIGRESDT
ncbi:hypothetical protein FRB94_010486 [Tulasnella sp. JGI-2019a]|nr:hypothetical protein FRB94_010486 [Tulasnella sp. JGI-2019a]KAG9017291.1 hypothetical protein FRB93_007404 [Tulasnella sp. JGI-2019a]KAG9024167.1 hypothetical protein FRB95_012021 [Tulasnella sp. JGI-2019a]